MAPQVRPPPQFRSLSSRGLRILVLLGFSLVGLGCTCSRSTPQEKEEGVSLGATAQRNDSSQEEQVIERPQGDPVPVGPRLIVAPGKGLSALRFGATFDTVERHMGAPCDIRTEDKCIYVRQAVEFSMKDGVVVGMKAHRRDRTVASSEEKAYYGTFRGILFPKIMMGLHRHVVVEEFGEPQEKQPLKGPDGQVERHVYDGVILEYDRLENGNTVLSGIEVVPSDTAPPGPQK